MKSDDATNGSESNGAARKEEGDKNGSDVRTEEAKEEEGDKNGSDVRTEEAKEEEGDKNGSDVRTEEVKEEEGDKNGKESDKVAETGDKNGEGSDVRNEEASADASRPAKSISEVSVIHAHTHSQCCLVDSHALSLTHSLSHSLTHCQPPKRCSECRQFMDDSSFKVFLGDPENAVRLQPL